MNLFEDLVQNRGKIRPLLWVDGGVNLLHEALERICETEGHD